MKILTYIIFALVSNSLFGQVKGNNISNYNQTVHPILVEEWEAKAKKDIKKDNVKIMIPLRKTHPRNLDKLTKKYGFTYDIVFDYSDSIPPWINVYDTLVKTYLLERNGSGWEEKLVEEIQEELIKSKQF